jgi:hypothetical protein
MATIYRKTPKGHTEIESRALRLSPRMRSALILVDGRRSDEDLQRVILQQSAETLHSLVEHGLIEVISITQPMTPARAGAPAAQPAPPAPVNMAPAVAAPALPRQAPAQPLRSFETLRADLVRSFTDTVGPMSEALAIKMERARTGDELRPLAQVAQRIIGNARGGQAANDFGAKFLGPLGG